MHRGFELTAYFLSLQARRPPAATIVEAAVSPDSPLSIAVRAGPGLPP